MMKAPGSKQTTIIETGRKVCQWRPGLLVRAETHLEYTVFYVGRDNRNRWVSAVIAFARFETAEALIAEVLRFQTAFVQAHWTQLEVMIPNRDAYGNLQSGTVKETGVLQAYRAYREKVEYR